jgi:hypothetical protein
MKSTCGWGLYENLLGLDVNQSAVLQVYFARNIAIVSFDKEKLATSASSPSVSFHVDIGEEVKLAGLFGRRLQD